MKEAVNRIPRLNGVYRTDKQCPFLAIGDNSQTPPILCKAAGLTLGANKDGFINTIPGCEQVKKEYAKDGCLKGKIDFRQRPDTARLIP